MQIEEETELFRALADPTRLKLFKLLCCQNKPNALCVNALVELLGVSQPAVSQHLKVLKNIGLINGERRGYHIHYSINRETLKRYRNLVKGILTIKKSSEEQKCQKSRPIRGNKNASPV